MRAIPDIAVTFVREHEGARLKAYEDSAGVWTIGVGHTGPEVKQGLTITKRQVDLYLKEDLAIAARRLARVVREEVILGLQDCQYAALVSFCFNVGCKPSWGIWRALNGHRFDAVPSELMKFTKAGGKQLPGLVNRRAAEVALWNQAAHEAQAPMSSAVTRLADTPPVEQKPKTGQVVTALVGACGTVPVAAQQVTNVISPYADHSELVGRVVAIMATIAAASAVVLLALHWLQSRHAR